jgi:hypothetical protein
VAPLVVFASCLKTLDESKLDQKKDGGKAGSGADSGTLDAKDSGKDGNLGGTGGTGGVAGDGPSGGTGGGADAPVEAGIVPWDKDKYPVKNLASGPGPIVIGVDDTYVYRSKQNAPSASFYKHPIAGGSGAVLSPLLERPQAMAAPINSTFVFVAGGRDTDTTGAQGSLVRVPKGGGAKEEIAISAPVELGAGIAEGADGFIYVSFKALTPGGLGLVRVALGSTTAEKLCNAPSGNETGGDVAVGGDCIYWISNGSIGTVATAGGNRLEALQTPITNAVGITTDANNLYYTRSDGSVWKRPLLAQGCDGSSVAAEALLTSGFTNIGDLVAYDNKVAISVKGDPLDSYKGGGIFALPVDGGTIVQIGPAEFGPVDIDQGPFDILYTTDGATSTIRSVPKNPVQ